LTIVVGHFGVGKTNFCLNLVAQAQGLRRGEESGGGAAVSAGAAGAPGAAADPALTLIDLDLINPYFRSSEAALELEAKGVRLLGPVFARTTLDTPSLAPGIDDALREASAAHPVVIDVGGDPDGARALARFAPIINSLPYRMLYLANFKRPEVADPQSALAVLRLIEEKSHIKVTGLIGNTHLKQESTVEDIMSGLDGLQALAELASLPVLGIAVPAKLADDVAAQLGGQGSQASRGSQAIQGSPGSPGGFDSALLMPIQTLVGSPWELDA